MEAAEAGFSVRVKAVAGGAVAELRTSGAQTVAELIERASAEGEAAGSSLVFRGRVLRSSETLAAAGVGSGATLILARRRGGGVETPALRRVHDQIELTVKRVGSEDETRLTLRTGRPLGEGVRPHLRAAWGLEGARLVHGGRVLHPDATPTEAGLADGAVVFAMASVASADPPQPAAAAADAGADAEPEAPEQAHSGGADDAEATCRICHGGRESVDELGPLFSPCRCDGTMKHVHVECLNRWRRVSTNPRSYFTCDACGYAYNISRTAWAARLESSAAAEVATLVLCLLMVCGAALPCYWLSLHSHFVRARNASSRCIGNADRLWMCRSTPSARWTLRGEGGSGR